MKPSTTLIFRYDTKQPAGRKGLGFSGGVWGDGEGFVTPAGIGVSVPPRGKSLPSSLQFKLGTKKYVYVLFLVSFHFSFFFFFLRFYSVLLFVGQGGVQNVCRPFASLYPLPNIQYRMRALLCFNLLLYSVVDVWRRGISTHLQAHPSLLRRREAACRRTATTLASR